MRTALLACALFATACGGSNDQPAQTPSSSTTLTDAPPIPRTTTTTQASGPALSTPSTASTAQTSMPSTPSVDSATQPTPTGAAAVASDPGAHDRTNDADNTKINDRDRHGGTLTPMDQGNSSAEIKITAAIRRGVMGDKSLSATAKNVKIITVGTKVTLRGPVKSDQERAAIEARAKQTPGVTDVDDQIEVKK